MKQACLKRVLCYACCLSLVLGVFAYKPAKAEAVFVSPLAALGASLIASVVVGTTATFFVESGAADGIGEAIDFLLEEYISVMDELTTYTPQDICEIVGNGASMLENGVIQLSSHAGNLTAGFINWLQGVKGLFPGAPPFSYFIPGSYYSSPAYNTLGLPSLEGIGVPEGCYCFVFRDIDTYSLIIAPLLVDTISSEGVFKYGGYPRIHYVYNSGAWQRLSSSTPIATSRWFDWSKFDEDRLLWTNFNIYSADDAENLSLFYLGDGCEVNAPLPEDSVTLTSNLSLQPIPNILPDQSSLIINLPVDGLDLSDQQGTADAIMGAINAGTLSPSVTIEGQATDIPGAGTDDDTVIAVPGADADLLDWTKYIGQKVASIPKAIGQSVAEAVAVAFSPDPKLVNEITGAFSAKFGFVETLKRIGDDLFGMTAASEPPVVWIHLEDAEGRYEYGGTVKALDMAWYQRYKADVDRIFGGFLWVAYCWLLFKRAPDILSGAGMAAAEAQSIDDHQLVSGQWIKVRRSKRL